MRSTLLQALAGLVLAAGLYFTAQTLRLNRESAARTYELQREGQITERFTRAIDQLGDEKLDVRLGGIYALERIAKSSTDDHGPVMEVLTAYVREHAPWPPRPAKEAGENEPAKPSTDIQAVIAVLGRREISGREEQRLDLSSTDLKGAKFGKGPGEGNFEGAIFDRTRLEGAYLEEAKLTGAFFLDANLTKANLFDANLMEAYLVEANLAKANLQAANLTEANLAEANLAKARLVHARLTEANLAEADLAEANLVEAKLMGADLSGANLTKANLSGANLTKANLWGANVRDANLTEANLEAADFREALYDSDTKWPSGFDPEAEDAWLVEKEQQIASGSGEADLE